MTIEFVGISTNKPHVKRGAKYLACGFAAGFNPQNQTS
jgi:hypothetical protein